MHDDERYGDWIQTHSGRKFWPLDPRPEDILISDIAWALAKVCRFGGHCTAFYSVGQHCVVGSLIADQLAAERGLDRRQLGLAFLLHDASEAYLGDLMRPLKQMPEFEFYRETEKRLQRAIALKFNVGFDDPLIKEIDDMMLFTERRDFLVEGPGWSRNKKPLDMRLTAWTWQETGKKYLQRFECLTGG